MSAFYCFFCDSIKETDEQEVAEIQLNGIDIKCDNCVYRDEDDE